MIESIKMNGGSFKLPAVLAYRSEAAFVRHYNGLLSAWMTEDQRKETLKQVYRIARALKRQRNVNGKGNIESVAESRHSPGREDNLG